MNQFETILTGYRQVELRWEESLQRLAARELGDAQKWIDIANMNGLKPPYVTGDPIDASDTVALYGDVLWVQSATPMVSSTGTPHQVFDQDVQLTNGKLTATNGDFDISFGVDNLTQALRHRMSTDKLELTFHPEYGCNIRALIGGLNSSVAELLAISYVTAALRADVRVKDVTSCTVTVTGDQIYAAAEIVPISGRALQFGGYL